MTPTALTSSNPTARDPQGQIRDSFFPRHWGPWRWTLFGLLLAACVFTRLYDLGDKALMHDESLFVYYCEYQLHREWTYNYMPILHGPLMIELQAMVFHVFGDSTYTMRLGCGLLGIAGFLLILGLRPFFGESGTWAALTFYVVSTGLTFYSRFFRNDALFHFLTILIILCACWWYRTQSRRWLVGLVLAIVLLFCNKENSLILYFSGISFFVFWVIQDAVQWFLKGKSGEALASKPYPAPEPAKVPNAFWLSVAIFAAGVLVFTRVFEGIKFDADVVRAVGHDYFLKDVHSLKLLLGILPPGVESAKDLPWYQSPWTWRKLYAVGFLFLLGAVAFAKVFIRFELGHREVLTRFWNGLARNKWWLLAAAALGLFIYLGVFTTWFKHPRGPFKIYRDTFGYWLGQHEWERITGPFHYQMVITLIYELPAVLLMVGGWMLALARPRWGRVFILPLLGLLTLLCVLYFNSAEWEQFLTSPVVSEAGQQTHATGKAFLKDTINVTSGVHVYLILVLSAICVVLTWKALWRGQIFHAWLLWWAVSSIGGYSYAGEKVPWVGTHMMLPIVLLAASYTGKLWDHWGLRHRGWFFVILGIFVLWNAKAMINANFRNNDDIRERVLYGHTSEDLKQHADDVIAYWKRASIRPDWQRNHNDLTKLKEVRVLVKATDSAIWPLRWYFRNIEWTEYDDPAKAQEKYEFVFLDANDLDKYPNIREHYTVYRGRGRGFWQPQLPDWKRLADAWLNLIPRQYEDRPSSVKTRAADSRAEWKKIKDYLLHRRTFERAGSPYPSVSSVDYFFCVRKDVDL